jgi:GNAT superfamily N-acetyltransferase
VAGLVDGRPVGLLVMDRIALAAKPMTFGAPYLEQLSIRRTAMRQGIGRLLLERAIEWAGGEPLWLTTYAHIPWNRPFCERHGVVTIPESACPTGVVAILDDQRQALPAPHERIAMRRVADPR